jgi:hypothetical protein
VTVEREAHVDAFERAAAIFLLSEGWTLMPGTSSDWRDRHGGVMAFREAVECQWSRSSAAKLRGVDPHSANRRGAGAR